MSDKNFDEVVSNPHPFTIKTLIESPYHLMVVMMIARANMRLSYQTDEIVMSNIEVEFSPTLKIISPIGPIHICIVDDAPAPIRVIENEQGSIDLPPIQLHDTDGNLIHLMHTVVSIEKFHENVCDFISSIAPNAELLPLNEVYRASIPYFKRIKNR